MGKNKLILKRSSINIPYGFIIRHLSFYPSKDYEIEAIKRGEKPFYALAILGVKPSSAADEAGLQAGHRIIEINGQDVNTLSYSDVCKITESALELEMMIVTRLHTKSSMIKSFSEDPLLLSSSSSSIANIIISFHSLSSLSSSSTSALLLSSSSSIVIEGHSKIALKNDQHAVTTTSTIFHCPHKMIATPTVIDYKHLANPTASLTRTHSALQISLQSTSLSSLSSPSLYEDSRNINFNQMSQSFTATNDKSDISRELRNNNYLRIAPKRQTTINRSFLQRLPPYSNLSTPTIQTRSISTHDLRSDNNNFSKESFKWQNATATTTTTSSSTHLIPPYNNITRSNVSSSAAGVQHSLNNEIKNYSNIRRNSTYHILSSSSSLSASSSSDTSNIRQQEQCNENSTLIMEPIIGTTINNASSSSSSFINDDTISKIVGK
ncbi:hypothetical protein DINM_001375 [Dirofilaria immitis]|nr:hypothetical protein [Dirofilaria immitis]